MRAQGEQQRQGGGQLNQAREYREKTGKFLFHRIYNSYRNTARLHGAHGGGTGYSVSGWRRVRRCPAAARPRRRGGAALP